MNYEHNHIVIEAAEIDFENSKNDFELIIQKIDSNLKKITKK